MYRGCPGFTSPFWREQPRKAIDLQGLTGGYAPPPKGPDKPGKYEIANIEKVGNYAITITWKDGEDAGIYSWEVLERFADLLEIKKSLNENSDT